MVWSVGCKAFLFYSEILGEERVSDCETMRRENRRVAAMSWGAGDDLPPPKPTRIPNAGKALGTQFMMNP